MENKREYFQKKIEEIDKQIRETLWGDRTRLEFLRARRKWLYLGFELNGGKL